MSGQSDTELSDNRQAVATAKTKRELEFTSENYKLEVTNLPKHCKFHVVKQLLERHFKLGPHKIRVGKDRAYVAFTSEKERDHAISTIDNKEWKGRILEAKQAAPRHDPFVKKQRQQDSTHIDHETCDEPLSGDDIINQVCPLWGRSYEDQLKIKESSMRNLLNFSKQIAKLSPSLKKEAPKLFNWIQKNNKICCQYDGVEPSPRQIGYRNKCEFNVGPDGVVGFRSGRYKDGHERVVQPPPECPIVNKDMFKIIVMFQTLLQDTTRTKLRGFDNVTHEGHVRQLTIRTNERNECLIIVDINPQDFSIEDLENEIQKVVKAITTFDKVLSIYVNISAKEHINNRDSPMRLVFGQDCLYEYLEVDPDHPLKFRISPTSFFQVNTKAAELLYRSIIELAQLKSTSIVLDVGCGTGTIGLSLAKQVNHVIGIEIVESSIKDAKTNAATNGISNVSFYAGKAEDLINESILIAKSRLANQTEKGEIVAIVDPPRTGFNNSFVKSLRASNLRKIIYVACDPKANTNLISLCRPKSKAYQGDPFVPTRAKAFDLFPHTKFCELLLVYERLDEKLEPAIALSASSVC